MDKEIIYKQRQLLNEAHADTEALSQMGTTSITKVTTFDGYSFSLTIIRPFSIVREIRVLPVFLFVPHKPYDTTCIRFQEQIASELVKNSGHAAAILDYKGENSVGFQLFEMFAAMKWLACHGSDEGINASKMAIVGLQLGANITSVLTQMAMSNNCPEVSLQILIDPQFYISPKNTYQRPGTCKIQPNFVDPEWLNIERIYDLPLDSKVAELIGIPPTLIQLSGDTGLHCELEYYCTKLLHAGTNVTYINYEARNEKSQEGSILHLNRTLIADTATELRRLHY
ncbi:alpha/beta hydrolase fold domain-containing protein [Dyadobacter chenhuakuii]|uniref:Alpha/beta hydrolase n=1 Tax=Dyadobacter chenhuakuii TaxID=2909339 RepID=A0A9X1QA35_9BACT|nr:alpha/beta hydrolase fold domain-containing protein [Dyadobacter chenhuakuii]MCF2496722.1 alpha/beta hydrolase [Dyadobacter chenhuakuii]